MPKIQFENGPTVEVSGNPSPQDVEEIAQNIGLNNNSQQPQGQEAQQPNWQNLPSDAPYQSPISNVDKLKMGFLDPRGQEAFLKSKFGTVHPIGGDNFLVGNGVEDLKPVKASSFFDDVVGKLAESVGQIPSMVGQMGGSMAGTAIEPGLGTVAGGGIGAAAGEAVKQKIASALGFNRQTPEEAATDNIISGAFGAGFEGLGEWLKAGANGWMQPKIAKAMSEAMEGSYNPTAAQKLTARIFKFVPNVPEEATHGAMEYGWQPILQDKYGAKSYGQKLSRDLAEDIVQKQENLGEAVAAGKDWAVKNFGSARPDFKEEAKSFLDYLTQKKFINPATGMIDQGSIGTDAEKKALNDVMDNLFDRESVTPATVKGSRVINQTNRTSFANSPLFQYVPKDLQLADTGAGRSYKPGLFTAMNDFGHTANKFFDASGSSVSGEAKLAVSRFMDGLRSKVAASMFPEEAASKIEALGGIKNLPQELIDRNPYLKANKAFANWRSSLELLGQNGLDLTDMNELRGAMRGQGKLLSTKLEEFVNNYDRKYGSTQEAFKELVSHLPRNAEYTGAPLPGGKPTQGTIVDEIRKLGIRKEFDGSSPNILRVGLIASLAGMSHLGSIPKVLLGFGIGTPEGASNIVRGLAGTTGVMARTGERFGAAMAHPAVAAAERSLPAQSGAAALRALLARQSQRR